MPGLDQVAGLEVALFDGQATFESLWGPAVAAVANVPLARSLIATVHGHCTYALDGSFALMGETDPVGLALDRVREAIAAARVS